MDLAVKESWGKAICCPRGSGTRSRGVIHDKVEVEVEVA